MHPLTTFPSLLTFGLVAPLLLRLAAGAFILSIGWDRWHKPARFLSIGFAVAGVLVVIGLYTQIAAMVSIILIWTDFGMDAKGAPQSQEKKLLCMLLSVILLSLMFTGPGFYAFDLPL
jgi:hypothetical protein